MTGIDIKSQPIHLGPEATAEAEPPMTGGMAWYEDYVARDGADGRLVSMYTFTGPWDKWEMHPLGSEVVLCLDGAMTLHLEHADGATESVALTANRYVLVPPGSWHTADVDGSATGLFITPGQNTRHRPR